MNIIYFKPATFKPFVSKNIAQEEMMDVDEPQPTRLQHLEKTTTLTKCICLEVLADLNSKNIKLKVAKCGHILCQPCVDLLFKKEYNVKCPFCKINLKKSDLFTIFY
jgi:hypothetical protein